MGYLGGPNFPHDPTDLGPLVPLPGGYQEVFQFLAECGYGGFEFFQLSQNAAEPRVAPIRPSPRSAGGWTPPASSPSAPTRAASACSPRRDPGHGTINATGQTRLARGRALGHTMIGTAGDPSSANTIAAWQTACANYNKMGQLLLENYGIKAYLHPEQNNWQFIADPRVPVADRPHRIDFWVANTDPRYVFIEPDIFHMYNARGRFPNPDGSLWDPISYMQKNWKRLVGWHVKDAVRTATPVAPPGNPWDQTQDPPGLPDQRRRRRHLLHRGPPRHRRRRPPAQPRLHDRPGYGFDPGRHGAVGRARAWTRGCGASGASSRRSCPTARRASSTTSWSPTAVPAPAADPGRSLRHAKISAKLLLGLK